LSYGGSGLVSGLFAGSGFGLGFSGVVESPWKALENRLGWLVSESGLILGYFCFDWAEVSRVCMMKEDSGVFCIVER